MASQGPYLSSGVNYVDVIPSGKPSMGAPLSRAHCQKSLNSFIWKMGLVTAPAA